MNRTQWFLGSVNPVHQGVYQRLVRRANGPRQIMYSYWNGSYWSNLAASIKAAFAARGGLSGYQYLPWRGLLKAVR